MSSDPDRAPDVSNDDLESVEDVEDENAETNDITRQVLRQADVLAAIQGQLRQEMLNVSLIQFSVCFLVLCLLHLLNCVILFFPGNATSSQTPHQGTQETSVRDHKH